MKKYIKPEIVEVKLGEEIMFGAQSATLNYDSPAEDNAFENGCAKENNSGFSLWGDDED